MQTRNLQDIVDRQFSATASAYLDSPVHASGADLDALAELVGHRPGAMALDVGCGAGHVAFRLAPLVGQVIAYDLSAEMLAVVAKEARGRGLDNLMVEQGSAERLPFADASFDLLASRFSAHHWGNVTDALRELRRVAKPGAPAFFVDVVAPETPLLDTWLQTLELLRDPSHVRNRSLDEWRRSLRSAGFEVQEPLRFRCRLECSSWVARMRTPRLQVEAIRALQAAAPQEVGTHFAIEEDGSFTLDTALIPSRAV